MTIATADLFISSAESDHDADGYHQRHTAAPERIPDVARAFRERGYLLEHVTCEDRRADEQKMRLVYQFNLPMRTDRHAVFVDLPGDLPDLEAPTIEPVYRGADWFEREIFDMYGVRFAGHPNLKRILLPEDAEFHALLKDFGVMETPDNGQT